MAKIGKIFMAIIIFGGIFVFPAVSQQEWTREDLQNIYMEYLRQEGYVPSVDGDGDVQFKVSGDTYFIIVDENDLQFFQVYMGFKMETISPEITLAAVNYSNRSSKVVKVAFSPDRKVISITAELLLNDPKDFIPVFSRAISLIQNAENNFISQVRDF
jgi:hypothetical protein